MVAANSSRVVLEMDAAQFPFEVHSDGIRFKGEDWEEGWKVSGGSWLIEFSPDHIIPAGTGSSGCFNGSLDDIVYTQPRPGQVELQGEFTKTPAVGNYLVMRHSTRDHAGMFFYHSKDVRLQDVNIYHTAGLGVLSQYSENLHFLRTHMIPNAKKGRTLSGHDDGFHFMGCRGEIHVDGCRFQGLMDDPINIHGTCVPIIEKIDERTLRCQFAHSMSSGLVWGQAGDRVGFIDNRSMNTIAKGTLKRFESIDKDTFQLTFQDPLPVDVRIGYALENISCTPNATITNCYVGCCRARGILVSTPGKTLIENNVFETSGSAILIAGDANQWYESGAVTDLTIRGNEFRASCNSSAYQFCEAVISIFPEIPEVDPQRPYHRGITIEDNVFHAADYPILYAFSVAELRFHRNTILRSHAYLPWHENKATITIDACQGVEILDNTIHSDVLGKNIRMLRTPKQEVRVQNDIVTADDAK